MLGSHPVVLAVVLTAYAYRSHIYIPAFRKIESLYKNGIVNYPDCVSNVANLGERYLHIGQTHRARRLLEEGLKLEPDGFLCCTNMAAYWISVKGFEQALYYTEKALMGKDGSFAKRVLSVQHAQLVKAVKKSKELTDVADKPYDEPREKSVAEKATMPVHDVSKQPAV